LGFSGSDAAEVPSEVASQTLFSAPGELTVMTKKVKSKTRGLYRDGKLLVIHEGARFPHACAVCNKAGDEEAVFFTFARARANVVEAAAVQAASRAVNDLFTGARYTGPVDAQIPLCSWCRGRRLRFLGTGVGLTVLAIGYLMIHKRLGGVILPPGELGFLEISLPVFVALGSILVGFVLTLMAVFDSEKLWFKATKYFDRFVWVSGAGKEYLGELPQYEDQHRKVKGSLSRRSSGDEGHLSAEELIRRANLDDDE
jgi:hypothetical protein